MSTQSQPTALPKHTPHYCALDTFPAELRNGLDTRIEEVTEICDLSPGSGTLLCYASPDKADEIRTALNTHPALLEIKESALEALGEHPESEANIAARIRMLRKEARDYFTAWSKAQCGNDALVAENKRLREAAKTALASLQNLHELQQWDKQDGDHIDEAVDAENELRAALAKEDV